MASYHWWLFPFWWRYRLYFICQVFTSICSKMCLRKKEGEISCLNAGWERAQKGENSSRHMLAAQSKTYHHPLRGEASIKDSAAGATSSADVVSHWGHDSTEAEVIPSSWILCAHGGGRLLISLKTLRVFCRVLISLWDLALIWSKNIAILMWKIIHCYYLWNKSIGKT